MGVMGVHSVGGSVIYDCLVAGLKYIFLVGGFAESPMLQLEMRNAFSDVATILVPTEAGLTILKGQQRCTFRGAGAM